MILVVYESMFGNTKAIAEAIGEGLAPVGSVTVVEVGAFAATPAGRAISNEVELLVVGGPIHAFGLSRPSTREEAAKKSPDGSVISDGEGLREWLGALSLPDVGAKIATFDTKVARPKLPGSAAKAAEKQLRGLGGKPVARPRTFWVTGYTGLVAGELDAARAWGGELAVTLPAA